METWQYVALFVPSRSLGFEVKAVWFMGGRVVEQLSRLDMWLRIRRCVYAEISRTTV